MIADTKLIFMLQLYLIMKFHSFIIILNILGNRKQAKVVCALLSCKT